LFGDFKVKARTSGTLEYNQEKTIGFPEVRELNMEKH
jgi:hypothetical protein